jgi:hypothetical protein
MESAQMAARIQELENELAQRPSRQELDDKDDELRATRQRLRKAQDDLEAKEFELRGRPTDVAHEDVKIDLMTVQIALNGRPTQTELASVKSSLNLAELGSKFWKEKYVELVKQQPSRWEQKPGEEVELKLDIELLEMHIERRDASIEALKRDRDRLNGKIARIQSERVQDGERQEKWNNDLRQQIETLRASLEAADGLVRSANAEQTKCKDVAAGRIRELQNGAELLRAELAIARFQLQGTKAENERLTTHCTELERKLEDATGAVSRAYK